MGVISWLADLFGLVRTSSIREELKRIQFEEVELQKTLGRLRTELAESEESRLILMNRLEAVQRELEAMEETAAHENELSKTAQARVGDLENEIKYLREQVQIYQQRMGLLPQVRQVHSEQREIRPLRKAREPFAVAEARIQAQRSEEYWRARANAAESGTTGKTLAPAVSDKEK